MVTVHIKIKTGLLGGGKVDATVTRPGLVDALAVTILALIQEKALSLGDLLKALRSARVGDSTPRPVVTRTTWGIDLVALNASFRGAGAALAEAMAATRAKMATATPPTAGPEPLQPLDLSGVKRKLEGPRAEQPPAE